MQFWSSGWLWIPAGAIAALGAVILVLALFLDGSRGRLRCPSCWYDLSGSPGTTCPECGRAMLKPRQLLRTRRHWGWAAIGTLFLLPAGGLVISRYHHQILYSLLPKWKTVEVYRSGDAVVERMVIRDPRAIPQARAVVRVRGRTLADVTDFSIELGASSWSRPGRVGLFEDLNGDRIPDLVVMGYSGGAHCCFFAHLYSLGDHPRVLAGIDARDSGVRFEPTGPGTTDLVLADPAFNYWKTAFVSSPKPEVWLRLTTTGVEVDPDRQRRPLPSKPDLDTLIQQQRAACFSGSLPTPEFWGKALDLLYSGHQAEAWDLLNAPWPPNSPERDTFLRDFRSQLETSTWWPRIRAALYQPVAGGPAVLFAPPAP